MVRLIFVFLGSFRAHSLVVIWLEVTLLSSSIASILNFVDRHRTFITIVFILIFSFKKFLSMGGSRLFPHSYILHDGYAGYCAKSDVPRMYVPMDSKANTKELKESEALFKKAYPDRVCYASGDWA